MSALIGLIWKLMAGERLRYGSAIAAMVVASCFLYLAPLVPQVVLDGVLLTDPGVERTTMVARGVDLLGRGTCSGRRSGSFPGRIRGDSGWTGCGCGWLHPLSAGSS